MGICGLTSHLMLALLTFGSLSVLFLPSATLEFLIAFFVNLPSKSKIPFSCNFKYTFNFVLLTGLGRVVVPTKLDEGKAENLVEKLFNLDAGVISRHIYGGKF